MFEHWPHTSATETIYSKTRQFQAESTQESDPSKAEERVTLLDTTVHGQKLLAPEILGREKLLSTLCSAIPELTL